MNAIDVENLTFSYRNKPILNNVSFTVERSDFAYVVGRNGSGKSTLIKLLLGLLKPNSGNIKVFGLDPVKGRHLIGYTPQLMDFDPLFPATVKDVIKIGRLKSRKLFYNREDNIAVNEIIEQMELKDIENEPLAMISGGQRQRVLISRALVSHPKLLILDEPTSNIDEQSEQKLYTILKELNLHLPIIMVSHDLYFTQEKVNKVLCIHDSKIATHDTSKLSKSITDTLQLKNILKIDHDHCKGDKPKC